MAQTPSKNCAICKKLAALYCYDCQQQLCLQCKQNKHDRVYQDHNVVDIPEAGYRIFKPVPVCDVHKRIFLYYCSKCDCLTCKECMTSSHDGHNTNEIKEIADVRRQVANQITNKLKAKVEKIKKTLETIDGDHSFLIQSGCDSYIEDMEKTSVEIQQIIDDKKHIERTTAFDHRENETRDLTAKRNFFQRHHNEFADQLLKFENLLQERHDNSFFMECKGLQKEYHIMNEESEQRLSSPRQMPGFNQDTFRRVIIDEIDTQFKMGLKDLEIAFASLTKEKDEQNKELKGNQKEIENLLKELQLKKKAETEFLDKNKKMKKEIEERNIREGEVLNEQKTTVVRLTKERDTLKEKLKGKDEEIANLSKKLQLKKTEETALLDKNSKLQIEIKEKHIREVKLLEEQKTTVVALTNEMDALKEQLKGKSEEIGNLSKELQLKKKEETTLLDKNSKLQKEIKEGNRKEVELLKEQESTVVKMSKERDALREKLKGKEEEIDNLSKLSLELQLKEKKEFELIEENNNLKTERIERNLREFALLKEHETAVVRHTEEMGAIKEKLKEKEEEIYNLSKLERQDTTEKIDGLLEELKEKQEKLSILSSLLQQNENENKKLKTDIEKRYLRELALFLKNVNIQNQNGRLEINSADETNDTKLEQSFPPIEENVLKNFKGNISQQRGALMIAAIEFGTTNSGWAYSFDRELKPHYPDIFIKKGWEGINGKQTVKTPTVALFDPEDQFHSFGYQAELTYAKLIDKDEASGWKYFKGFNMARFTDETTEIGHHKRDLAPENSINQHELEDVNGATLSSLTVFSECLRFLKDDVLTSLTSTINDQVGTRNIHWIILIPAVWSKYGQQFMRLAANQAGIVNEQLYLVYEPIAVAIDCKMWQTIESIKCITSLKEQDRKNTLTTAFDTEEKFLVINCGEDTVHIAAYKSQMGNKHVEIIRPTSLQCGGKEVDNQFLDLVLEIFGVDIWHNFEKKIIFEYLEMRTLFESQRSVIGSNDEDKVKIRFPAQLFHEYRLETGLEFQSVKGVMKSRDRLIFPIQVFNDIFEKPANKIAGHVKQMLQKPELAGLGTIFMAGSFSESPLLYEQMKLIFSSFNVLRPNESGLSALKGAVIVGYTPVDIHEKYL